MTTAAMEANPVTSTGPATEDDTGQVGRTINGLTLYERLPNAMDAIKYLGGAIATSKMFGCPEGPTGLAQGVVIATTCLAERITPFDFRRRYHVIGGNVTMQANAMLAEFVRRGGEYEIISATSDKAEVLLKKGHGRGQKTFTSSITWEEALGEPWPYDKDATHGKTPKRLPDGSVNPRALKTNWATPRARANMLWARCVSEGVRRFDCTVNHGVYTPEEVSDYAGVAYVPPESPPAPVVAGADRSSPIVDAEYQPAAKAEPQPTATSATPEPHRAAGIRPDQIEILKRMKAESSVSPETWKEWLGKCNATSATQLTELQAADCAEWLSRVIAANNRPAGGQPVPKPDDDTPRSGPAMSQIRPEQIESLKRLKSEFAISGDAWKGYLAEYNVDSAAKLTALQATYFEGKVRFAEESKRKNQAAAQEGPPFDTNDATSPPEPVSPEQLSKLKSLVTGLQLDVATWKQMLGGHGVDTAKNLNSNQAEMLITDLEKRVGSQEKRDALSAWADSATVRGN